MTEQIAKQGVRDYIQRRRKKEQPLTTRQQQSNKHVVKTQARVEQVFAAMEQMGGKLVRCIGPVLEVNPSVAREKGTRWLKNHQLRLISYPQ